MHCIEPLDIPEPARRKTALALASLLAIGPGLSGCALPRRAAPSASPAPAPAPSSSTSRTPGGSAGAPSAPVAAAAASPRPGEARNWRDYTVLAARRLVQMNPDSTYMTTPPDPLLAIPVLEIELYIDGSIASIRVQRTPTQATDTVQLAIAAVRRAAPFPAVGHLPKPWRFSEVFLFDDKRRFKPRSLD